MLLDNQDNNHECGNVDSARSVFNCSHQKRLGEKPYILTPPLSQAMCCCSEPRRHSRGRPEMMEREEPKMSVKPETVKRETQESVGKARDEDGA